MYNVDVANNRDSVIEKFKQGNEPPLGFISASDAQEAASLTYDDLDKTVSVEINSTHTLLGSYDFQSAIVKFKSPALDVEPVNKEYYDKNTTVRRVENSSELSTVLNEYGDIGAVWNNGDKTLYVRRANDVWEAVTTTSTVPAVYNVPVGSIVMYSASVVPSGWLPCDGSDIPPDSEYNVLRALIGSKVPDLNNSVPRGTANQVSTISGIPEGSDTSNINLEVKHLPAHKHSIGSHSHGVPNHVHTMNAHKHGINHTHTIEPAFDSRDDIWVQAGGGWRVTPGVGRHSSNAIPNESSWTTSTMQPSGASTTTAANLETQNVGLNNSYSLNVQQKSTAVNFIIRAKESIIP